MDESTTYPPLGPLPLDVVEMPLNGEDHTGFALALHEVLAELGVPIDQVEYIARGKLAPNSTFKGYVAIHLRVPASKTLPGVCAFAEWDMDTSIDICVQTVSSAALCTIVCNAHEYL